MLQGRPAVAPAPGGCGLQTAGAARASTGRHRIPRSRTSRSRRREALDRLEALLDASARLALRSDVPVGILLSGGDRFVADCAERGAVRPAGGGLLPDVSPRRATASGRKPRRPRGQLGVPLMRCGSTTRRSRISAKLVEHADDPLADSSALAVWTLAREVAATPRWCSSGDGGDELFGGYLTYHATLVHDAVTSRMPASVRRMLAGSAEGSRQASERSPPATSFAGSCARSTCRRRSRISPGTARGCRARPRRLVSTTRLADATASALARLAVGHGLAGRPSLRQLQAADIARVPAERHPRQVGSHEHGARARSAIAVSRSGSRRLRAAAAAVVESVGGGDDEAAPAGTGAANLRGGCRRRAKAGLQHPGARLAALDRRGHSSKSLLAPRSLAAIPALDAQAVAAVVADHMRAGDRTGSSCGA